jgi:cullin 1
MFRLFLRVSNGLVPIAEILRQHIVDVGNEKIEQRLARCASDSKDDKETNDDPQFVKVADVLFFIVLVSKS